MFSVYIVGCSDGSFYIGYAKDVLRRIDVHNKGKLGAKYTKSRRPVTLLFYEGGFTKSEAMKRENYLKKLSHKEKKDFILTQKNITENRIISPKEG